MDQVISGRAVSNKAMEEKVESQRGQQARMSGNISNFFWLLPIQGISKMLMENYTYFVIVFFWKLFKACLYMFYL